MSRKKKILCGCYIRVSTEEQALVQEGSLKNQNQRLKDFVKWKNQGIDDEKWEIAKTYEEVKSAKDTNRPKYQEMLQDIKDGEINMVLFTELSRLSRSTMDFLEFGKFISDHGANFLCLSHRDLDTSSVYGKAFFVLITVLMEFEREINSTRSKEAYNARAQRGLKNGGQILGYDLYDEKGRHGHLKINTDEAKIVRFIFRSYLKEQSSYKVADLCNQRGYKMKSYKSRRNKMHIGGNFTYSTIKQILQNPAYIGYNEIHKKNKGKKDAEKGQEYKLVKTDKWKPIIDEDTFKQVQSLLARNRAAKSKPQENGHYDFLMSDLIYCHHCNNGHDGGEMVPLTHGGTNKNGSFIPHYIHRKKSQDKDCPLPQNISARKLDDAIWNRLVEDGSDKLDEALLKDAVLNYQNGSVPAKKQEIEEDIEELKKAITEQKNEHDNILKSMGKNVEKAGCRVAQLLKQLSDDIESLKEQLKERQAEFKALEQKKSVDAQVARIMKNKKKGFVKLPAEEKVKLAKILLKRVVLKKDTFILERRIGEPVVGVLKEHQRKDGKETISGKWRFVEVEWLN